VQEDKQDGLSDDELAHWLAFNELNGFGPARIARLDEQLESLKTAWNAPERVLERIKGLGPERVATLVKAQREIDPYKLLERLRESGFKAWTWKDPQYPLRLRHIHDAPIILFVAGNLEPDAMNHVVGIVGTRYPTPYGKKLAFDVAEGLSAHGVTIVSGLALGCDALAHMGAISGGSPTIAVLGCGADICYPAANQNLYKQILSEGKGAIISEYFPGTQPEPFRFPARNRIISGLSQALIVVEGKLTSGSLITGRLAFEQNRELFAFPGRVDSEMSKGPNRLILEGKAQLCTSYEDILTAMNWAKTRGGPDREKAAVVQLYGREREVYDLISHERIHFDTLCEQTEMEAGELSATLTMLELAGLVSREAGDWYTRFADLAG